LKIFKKVCKYKGNYLIFRKTIRAKVIFFPIKILFLGFLFSKPVFSQFKKYQFIENKMGSNFSIQFYDSDSLHAQVIAHNAFLIVDTLNNSFSDYVDNSEISNLAKNAGNDEWIKISSDLYNILVQSKAAFLKSNGAFDVTLGQLTKLWRITKKEKRIPTKQVLDRALTISGFKYLAIDTLSKKVKLTKKGVLIDLGGIGKGYAAQKVFDYFCENNLKTVLIDAAGNMAIGEADSITKYWKIGVEVSNGSIFKNKLLRLKNIAISTSGDLYQYIEIGGKRFSHIVNPKTGLGLSYQRQVTVICKNATTADWLSTAMTILPIKKAIDLAKSEKIEYLIIEKKGNNILETVSENLHKYLID
jgi:FAD:protein FMN transferase